MGTNKRVGYIGLGLMGKSIAQKHPTRRVFPGGL